MRFHCQWCSFCTSSRRDAWLHRRRTSLAHLVDERPERQEAAAMRVARRKRSGRHGRALNHSKPRHVRRMSRKAAVERPQAFVWRGVAALRKLCCVTATPRWLYKTQDDNGNVWYLKLRHALHSVTRAKSRLAAKISQRATAKELGCAGCQWCDEAARRRDEPCCRRVNGPAFEVQDGSRQPAGSCLARRCCCTSRGR